LTTTDVQIDELLSQLLELHPKRIDLSLERIQLLLSKLGNPQNQIENIIHIAGTNGKFSTLKFIQKILEIANKTTSAYISPHLIRFNERFELEHGCINNEDLYNLLYEVKNTNGATPITFFEITSACFFLAAARYKTNFTLLEVGLGGRLDSSNVVTPKVSVISSISNDHHDFLGDTVEKIAFEKAGIIKANVPVIIGKQPFKAAEEVLIQQAKTLNTRAFVYGIDWNIEIINNKIHYTDAGGLLVTEPLTLHGEFQLYNFGLALATTRQFESIKLNEVMATNCQQDVILPGRIQKIDTGNYLRLITSNNELFLDGSHNVDAAFHVNKALENLNTTKDLVIILGMINTKDPIDYIKQFKGVKEIKTITIPNEENAILAKDLSDQLQDINTSVAASENIEEALSSLSKSNPNARILICGSLYLAGQVLKNN